MALRNTSRVGGNSNIKKKQSTFCRTLLSNMRRTSYQVVSSNVETFDDDNNVKSEMVSVPVGKEWSKAATLNTLGALTRLGSRRVLRYHAIQIPTIPACFPLHPPHLYLYLL
jgi:hypothetical protein